MVEENDIPEIKVHNKLQNETMLTEAASVGSRSEVELSWEEQGSKLCCCPMEPPPEQDKSRGKHFLASLLVVVTIALVAAAVAVPLLLFHQGSAATSAGSPSAHHGNKTLSPGNPTTDDDQAPILIPDDDGRGGGGNTSSTPVPAAPASNTNTTTSAPTATPAPVVVPTNNVTTFCVIGDVPYNSQQAVEILVQMNNIPEDCEFVVHVGDLRNAGRDLTCNLQDYTDAEDLFRPSRAPVFMLLGDNEWNDCPNPDDGLMYWRSLFVGFERKYWNSPFNVSQLSGYPETFAFQWKNTLFIGIQLVGGDILDQTEWTNRLTAQAEWSKALITDYNMTKGSDTGRVVIFGHANPKSIHKPYFEPLQEFIANDLNNALPMLYINGDAHRWEYNTSWYDQPSFLRIMVTGGSSEPPLKVTIDGNGETYNPAMAFVYDRQLSTGFNYTASNVTRRRR